MSYHAGRSVRLAVVLGSCLGGGTVGACSSKGSGGEMGGTIVDGGTVPDGSMRQESGADTAAGDGAFLIDGQSDSGGDAATDVGSGSNGSAMDAGSHLDSSVAVCDAGTFLETLVGHWEQECNGFLCTWTIGPSGSAFQMCADGEHGPGAIAPDGATSFTITGGGNGLDDSTGTVSLSSCDAFTWSYTAVVQQQPHQGSTFTNTCTATRAPSCPSIAQDASVPLGSSCSDLLAANIALSDGIYTLDIDGDGPSPALPYYCDMTNGGWTLIANQVPGTPLPDEICAVNPAGFGSLTQSFRLGVPDITAVRPTVAWKLTDDTNAVYFKPDCVVDWLINYDTAAPQATVCTTGYTDASFGSVENGAWVNASARGIGINNSGASCSIRMYESHMKTNGAIEATSLEAGLATPCLYQQYTAQRVSLWFE